MSSSGGRGTYSIVIHLDANQANSVLNQFKTNLGTLNSTFQTSAGSLNSSAMGFERLGASATSAQMSVQKLVGISGPLSNSLAGAAAGSTRLTGSLANLNGRITGVVGGLGRANTLVTQGAGNMGRLATETEKASKSSLNIASNLRGMIIPIVGMGSAIVEAVGMFQAFQDTSRNVEDAQRKLNDTIKKYGEGSKEARDATQQLEAAQRGLQFILRNTIQSISDIGIFAALMANSFLKMRTSATALNPALVTTAATNAAVSTSIGAVTTTTNAAGGALTRFTGILRAIPLALGPIGIAFLVIGGAIATFTALYSQNIGGLRDSTNDFGAAVGEAIPILRPFGDLLVGIGGQLGITGESAERTAEHMRNATTGFQQMGTLWEQTLDNISNGFMEWGFNVQQGFGLVVDSFSNFFGDIGNQLGQWLGEFGARLQTGFNNVFSPLIGQTTDIAQGIADELNNFDQWLEETSVDILASIGIDRDQLVSQAEQVGKEIGAAIGIGLGAAGEFLTGGLKASQQPGASGNIGQGESFQDTSLIEKIFGVKPNNAEDIIGTSGGIKPGLTPSGQTWQDFLNAQRPSSADQILGLPPKTGTGLPPQARVLDLSNSPMTELFRKQSAVNTIIENQLKDQATAAKQAGEAYELLTNKYDLNTFAALDLKDAEKLLNDEGITVGVGALENLEAAQKAVTEGRQKAKTDDEILTGVERALNGEMETGSKKIEGRDTVIQKLRQSNDDLALSLSDTATAIQDQSLMQELSRQGTLEAQQAITDYGSELLKNTAFNKEWGAALDSNVFKQAAFRTGVQEQVAALNESKVAILEGVGSLAEYTRQIAIGEPQRVAFIRGQQEQARAFLNQRVALAENIGALGEYKQEITEGNGLVQAFAQGLVDGTRAQYEFMEGMMHSAGETIAFGAALENSNFRNALFSQGIVDATQAMHDLEASAAQGRGFMEEYNRQIAEGEIQTRAFSGGLVEGQRAAADWAVGLQTAQGEMVGFRQELLFLATAAGMTLPQAFAASNEELMRFVDSANGATEALGRLAEDFTARANEMGRALGGALNEGKGEFKDALKEIQQEMGMKLPKEIKSELKFVANIEEMKLDVNKQLDVLATTIGARELRAKFGLDTTEADQNIKEFTEGMLEDFKEDIERKGGDVETILAPLESSIIHLNSLPIGSDQWWRALARVQEEASKATLEINPLAQSIQDYANSLGPATTASEALSGAMETIEFKANVAATAIGNAISEISKFSGTAATEFVNYSPEALSLVQRQIADYQAGVQKEGVTQGPTAPGSMMAAPTIDTTPAKQAMDELLSYAANIMNQIAQTGQHVATIWNGHFTTAANNAKAQMDTLLNYATPIMAAIANAPATVATTWTTHFNTATQNAAGVLNTLISHAQNAMAQVAAAAQQVAVSFTTAFNTATQNAAGSINQLVSHVSSQMAAISGSFTQVAVAMTQSFEQGAQNAAGSINNLTTHIAGQVNEMVSHLERVVAAMNAIGDAAADAAGQVNSLAQAVNSVPTERTITFTIRTVGSIPSGGTVGGGLGTYNGRAYLPMAGGSAGISGLGFAPIVIDHPTNLLVGESGPELVSVTPINRNRNGRSGEMSPFADLRMAGGSSNEPMVSGQGFGGTINLTNGNVIFEANQGPITVNQGGAGATTAGIPTTGSRGFATNNVGLGTGQGAIFNVPGGQGAISGNATVCINGQCFGNPSGFGSPISQDPGLNTNQQQQGFQPVLNDAGMIDAMKTLVEWFKFLGLPTGASVPGTANFTPGTQGTMTGKGAFAQTGVGAFAGQISMQGGQVVFDANQGDMELKTSTGAISIAGQGGAFARTGNAIASAGNVGLFGSPENPQLTQLNRTMKEINGSMQAVGNSMAKVGDQIVFGNEQAQQTFQGINTNLQSLQSTTQQGLQNVVNGVNLFGAGNQVGFQGFTLPNGQQGGAVGAGGAANNPLGFLSGMLGGFGINNPFQGAVPTTGGTPTTDGTIGGTGGISTEGTGCNVCGAASGLGNAATDLSGAAGQLGNALGQLPTTGGYGTGTPTTNNGFPSGGGMGTPNTGSLPGTGSGCSCSCMPMDSDPNRYKIEDGSGNDCNNHIYFDTIDQCHSRLNEICPGENTNNPTPTNPVPTTPPQNPTGGQGMFPPGVSVSGPGAVACANGQCFGSNGPISGGGLGQQVPGVGQQIPMNNPPAPPQIVQQAGLPSQAPNVNQDPSKWTIVESAGLEGTYDIIDDSGDVVQLGFRTLRDAETYLNYFVSYYEWVKSGSTGIPGPTPIGMGTIGSSGMGTGIGAGISAGTGGGVQAIAGGGGAFAQAGNAIAQAGNFLGNALGFGSGKSQKKIGSVPVLESIPRAQGPFRSGQDNMEPIYDNSGIKIGASRGTPLGIGETTSQEEHEYGKSPRVKSRIQRHLNTALAIAGDRPEWVDAFLSAFEKMFGDLMINLTVNNMLDGYAINQSQKKYQVKKVSVYN